MKLTANIMVYNEEFWISKQLPHIYDFFDEIIICDGCEVNNTPNSHGFFTPNDNGLSSDNTKGVIEAFPDPDNKIRYIEHGVCGNKLELNKIMYDKSTSDYVWLIDADEFYLLDKMSGIKKYLIENTEINQINFRMRHFIDFDSCIHMEGGERWGDNIDICRIFRKEVGNNFTTHRPPTIQFKTAGRIIGRDESLTNRWIMYHYPYVFEWQVERKSIFYPNGQELKRLISSWRENHNIPLLYGSKTIPFSGKHPEVIDKYLKGKI